ncbi:hypothetical protein BpHYR1_003725 [Brachionus plicatilis]|uniref:RNA-directed DNA polymerase from mobile element jockey-like n=1 Tax=Brachionus plicatilis TaxID=10195 RepID=A0A3M7QUA5_BRAPC|nr:hypothetical protein BpHYR1_003725 [Brachionus plicatilis]
MLVDRYPDFNVYFQSDMELINKNKYHGRPFGGKCWLINKKLEVLSCDFDNPNFSVIKVKYENHALTLAGVWIPYNNGKKKRLLNFRSTISALESLMELNQSEKVILLGDWNCDLSRKRKFDIIFKKFINDNDLVSCTTLFYNQVNYTYMKGNYYLNIDHILVRRSDSNNITDCTIGFDHENLSDHNPVSCFLQSDNLNQAPVDHAYTHKSFHHFDWKNLLFTENFKQNLSIKLTSIIDKIRGTNIEDKSEVCNLLDYIFNDLPKSMLKAARETEKNLGLGKGNYTKRFKNELRSSEIVELNEENKELYDHLKHATNTSPSVKSKIRSNKKRLKHLIRKAQFMSELKNIIKLDRMKHFDRNKFWSIISRFKNKKAKVNKIQSKDLTADKFKSFYAELFSHTDKPNTQEQENIKKEVNEYFNSIQNRKVDFIVTGDDVEKSISSLSRGKSSGSDKLCNEFYIHGICGNLICVLKISIKTSLASISRMCGIRKNMET